MKNFSREKIALINKDTADFMGESKMFEYRDSGMLDAKGNKILEGSIINANGYNSIPEESYFHVVEFYEGQFGSNIYSDFEPLSSYQTIEVIGHVRDYVNLLEDDLGFVNLRAALKGEVNCSYHMSWDWLMPVIIKISTEIKYGSFPIDVKIFGQGGVFIAINSSNCVGQKYKGERVIASTLNLNSVEMEYAPIELAWIAVARFIEWYKKNKEL